MFRNKIVLITGGSSGVGRVLAHRMLKRGAHLALLARDRAKLIDAKKELDAAARNAQRVEVFSCDVTDPAAVEQTFTVAAEAVGAPDILVNSAGVLRESYFEHQSPEIFRETMDINFFGTLHCIRAALPYFKHKGLGRIVNMSSLSGVMGVFGYSAYCSSKYAVKGLTDTLRVELKPQNIFFHVVMPPEFESPMVHEMRKTRTPENQAMAHLLPVLEPEDVARAILIGMQRNRYEIVPGAVPRAAYVLDKLLPGMSRALTDRTVRRAYRGPDRDVEKN